MLWPKNFCALAKKKFCDEGGFSYVCIFMDVWFRVRSVTLIPLFPTKKIFNARV